MGLTGLLTTHNSNGGIAKETGTFTCGHCNKMVPVGQGHRPEDIGGFCKMCSGLICSSCVGKGCDPFEKKLMRMERRR